MVPAGPVDRAGQAAPMEATVQVGRAEEVQGPSSSKEAREVLVAREVPVAREAQQALAVLGARVAPDRAAEARDAVSSVRREVRAVPVDQVVLADQAVRSPAMDHLVRAMLFTQLL